MKGAFDVEQIRQWVEVDGRSYKWIAETLGSSTTQICRICQKNNVKNKLGRKPLEWPVQKIRTWIENEGKTHEWVASQLGCSSQHVSTLCKKHGIKAQRTGPRSGPGHPNWNGGVKMLKGYRYVWSPDHPNRTKAGYVAEHRLVMEQVLGRFLTRKEVVHHYDSNPLNNDPENLIVFGSNGEHLAEELYGRRPNWSKEGWERILEAAQRKSNQQ